MPHPLVSLLCRAVERRPPLNKRGAVCNDRTNAYRRDIVLHWKRRRAAERVGIGALDVGVGQQNLADDPSPNFMSTAVCPSPPLSTEIVVLKGSSVHQRLCLADDVC